MPETALYSAVCAVQNLWLAAHAEGIGVGWVSILDKKALPEVLHIPENSRIPLDQVLAFEQYDPRWSAREEKKP
jgi:nitroreductase